jgi:hypothetical protein
MAENKTVNLEVNSNLEQTEQAVVSLKSELRKAQQEVAALSDKFGATSKEAVEAAKRAADLKDRIGDAKALTDAFNPDAKFKALSASLGGVASGFAAYQGALGLIGVESKEVEAQILKVQSAMAIAQGAQAVGESVDAFKQLGAVVKSYSIVQKAITAGQWLWNAAMAANPIGALVAVVVALVAAGYALVKMFIASSDATMKAEAANKALNKQLDTQVKNQKKATEESDLSRDAQLRMAKASGKSAEEIRKLSVELANQEVKQKLANAQTLYAIAIEARRVAGLEDATDAQKETAEKALKAYNDANDALKASVLNRRKLLIDNRVAERQEETDAEKKRVEDRKKASEEAKAAAVQAEKEKQEAIKKAKEDALKEQQEIDKQYRDKQIQDSYKAQDDIIAAQKANADRLLTEQELAIQTENEAYKIKYDNAVKAGFDTEELEIEHLNKLNDINLTAQDKQYASDKAFSDAKILLAEKEAKAKMDALDAVSGTLNAASDLLGKQTTAGKVLAIASATISTFTSAQKAYEATVGIPIVGPALAPINAGIALAAGFKNIQAITKVKTPGGGGGSSPSGSFGGSAAQAPNFNVVGNSGVNQLAQTLGGQSEQAPIQAFVVANDVTTAQGLNRNIVTNASLG